jgi:type III pantothenate kinase
MKLLIDAGNSRIKWALAGPGGLVATGEATPEGGEVPPALLAFPSPPDEIRLANVAGAEQGRRLAGRLGERYGRAPLVARSPAAGAGVRNGYRDPAQLGVDRWLAVCAAHARYPGPLCVVDAGTATTVDLVTEDGGHQGGLILPGLALMESTLLRATGDLARLAAAAPPLAGPPARGLLLGRDTATAIRAGGLQATACLVVACLRQLAAGGGPRPVLVLTGGASSTLGAALAGLDVAAVASVEHRPWLVLEGLALDPPCFRAEAP